MVNNFKSKTFSFLFLYIFEGFLEFSGADNSEFDENFDYMELLDTQYAQYYAMASVPPFDPNPPKEGVERSSLDPVLAAALPGLALAHVEATQQVAAAAIASMVSGVGMASADESAASSVVTSPVQVLGSHRGIVAQPTAVVLPYLPLPMYSPLVPFMPVNEETLKEYIRNQMWIQFFFSLLNEFVANFCFFFCFFFREYYFSEENLQKDFFLRRKMDAEGYLPMSLIASFHRVQALTNDIRLIVEVPLLLSKLC